MRRGISTEGDEMGACTYVSGIFWSVYTLLITCIYIIVNKNIRQSQFLPVDGSVPAVHTYISSLGSFIIVPCKMIN